MVSDFGCDEKNYELLNDPKRNREHSGSYALSTCDQNPSGDWKGKAWYRFVEPAGTILADSLVPWNHCGGRAVGWLNGTLPTNLDLGEIITRTVCFRWGGAHCFWTVNVKIKQCNEFFLYELPGTDLPRNKNNGKIVCSDRAHYCGQ